MISNGLLPGYWPTGTCWRSLWNRNLHRKPNNVRFGCSGCITVCRVPSWHSVAGNFAPLVQPVRTGAMTVAGRTLSRKKPSFLSRGWCEGLIRAAAALSLSVQRKLLWRLYLCMGRPSSPTAGFSCGRQSLLCPVRRSSIPRGRLLPLRRGLWRFVYRVCRFSGV